MEPGATGVRDWCDERLADPAEDLYHAVLFTPPRLRGSVRAVAALFIELEAVATRFRDLHVARTKLAWWRDELERLHRGQAVHPVTRLLADGPGEPEDLLLTDLVTGMELILLEGPVTDLATAEMRAERGTARLAVVLARVFGAAEAERFAALGTAAALARLAGADGLGAEVRGSILDAARGRLREEAGAALAAPAPLRVLAALAWRRTRLPERSTTHRRADPARVITAWRAGRGRMPRKMVNRAVSGK